MTDNKHEADLLRVMAADIAVVKSTVQAIEKRDTDTEHRLRKVERWQWVAFGIALASAGGSLAALSQVVPPA